MKRQTIILGIMLATLAVGGCEFFDGLRGNESQRVAALQDAAATTAKVAEGAAKGVEFYQERSDKIASMLDGMNDGAIKDELIKAKAFADQQIAEHRMVFDRAVQTAKTLNDELAKAKTDADVLTAAVTAAAPWIPGPWGGLVATLAPVVFGLIGGLIGKKKGQAIGEAAAVDIAYVAEMGKDASGKLDFKDEKTVRILNGMSDYAAALVDRAQQLAKSDLKSAAMAAGQKLAV